MTIPERLNTQDRRFLAACCAICALCLLVGARYFYRAFPEAAIDFRVTRNDSKTRAEAFIATQDIAVTGYRHASAFLYDDDTKVFLERELGLERASSLMGREIRLWRWGHRWFRPHQKEEVRVEISTRGEVVGFRHELPEDAPGENLSQDAARALAESFLVLAMGRTIDSLEFVDSQTQKRPARTDHLFTWKISGAEYAGATYRLSVAIQGDRVDGYSEFLKIPEQWSRGYSRLRSLNESTAQVDLLLFAFLGLAMLVTLGRRVRLKDVRWKTAMVFGLIAAVLQLLAELNSLPLVEYSFDTTGSYGSFIGRLLVSSLMGSLAVGGIIVLLTACSEPLYRRDFPGHPSLSRTFSWHGIRTRSFFLASVAGITLTFFFFAYEIGFYLLANRLGAWAPAELPYSEILNTGFPWVYVLLGGFFPAVSEEWMFRAFSIPFLGGLLRRRWLAVVVASFIWGFGHANYPNQPFFIRGLEVGIVGLILSWAMLRFGILAPLIAHYSIDAFYTAFLFLRSGNPYLVATGAVTAGINLIPLVVALGAYLVRGRFLGDTPVLNAAEPAPPEVVRQTLEREEQPAPAIPYRPLGRAAAASVVPLLLLGGAALMFLPERFGQSSRFRVSRSEAETAAQQFLAQLGFSTQGFMRVTQPRERVDSLAVQYIYNARGVPGLNQFFGSLTPVRVWQTRFFKPVEKEEFRINVDPGSGRPVGLHHSLDEEAPGADLDPDAARKIAAAFLNSRGYDLSRFTLQETRSEKPKERRDTEFTWEAAEGAPGTAGQARLRLVAGVTGDTVGRWTHYVKIPEDWRRDRERQNFYSISVFSIRSLFLVALFAFGLRFLLSGTRAGGIPWRLVARMAALAVAAELVDLLNSIPEIQFQYDTRIDMGVFTLGAVVSGGLLILGIGLIVALGIALAVSCRPGLPLVFRLESLRMWARDAALAAAACLALYMILLWITAQIQLRTAAFGLAPGLPAMPDGGTFAPLISSLRNILIGALLFGGLIAFVMRIWESLAGRRLIRVLLIIGLVLSVLPADARHPAEALTGLAPSLLFLGFGAILLRVYFRDNYLAYFTSGAILVSARDAASLAGQGDPLLRLQGWVLFALLFSGIAWLAALARSRIEAYP